MTTHTPDHAAEIGQLLDRHACLVQRGDRDGASRVRQAAAPMADAARSMALAERLGDVLTPVVPRPDFRARLEADIEAAAGAMAARVADRRRRAARPRVRVLLQGGAAVAVVGLMAAAVLWRGRADRLPA